MLSLGPTSSCDICYEQYGDDAKAPWSIECGHVFCGECLRNVNDPQLCPMCRLPFDRRTCIRLHVDIDTIPSDVSSAETKEARRLQHAVGSIPETGATELSLRQLIQECSKFLSTQPRSMHKELRKAHRIISYLYDVKIHHRAQAQAIESMKEQAIQLTKEKEELLLQLEKLEETRQYERETATAVENTLREHCAQAKKDHKAASEQLKKLEQENEELKKQIRSSTAKSGKKTACASAEYAEPQPTDNYFYMSRTFTKRLDMSKVPKQDLSSFLISPLPQFTNNLPPMFDNVSPISTPDEDKDASDQDTSTEDEEDEVTTPDSCFQDKQHFRPSETRIVKSQSSAPESRDLPLTISRISQEPSGLSRTAPFREHRRRERSSSSPTPSNRSASPFDNILSTPSTIMSLHSSPQHQETSSQDAPPAHTQDRHVLRSRLHDILSESSTSSSLSTSPSFSSSLPRELSLMHKADHNHAGSSTTVVSSSQQPSSSAGSAHTSPSQSIILSKPSATASQTHLVGQRMSSASAEAKKQEEERRRKHWEEIYGPDYDKHPTEADREERWYPPVPSVSAGSSATATPATSSASQAARREHQPFVSSSNLAVGNTMPTLKRSSTTSGNYARSSECKTSHSMYNIEQGLSPPSGLLYSSASMKNPSKNPVPHNTSSHGPTIFT